MSKQIYINEKEKERVTMNNKIDKELVDFINLSKIGLQMLVKNRIIAKADIIEGMLRHAINSVDYAVQVDENLYTYKDLVKSVEVYVNKFMNFSIEKISNYEFIKREIDEYDNEIDDERHYDEFLIDEILSDLDMVFGYINEDCKNINIVSVINIINDDFMKDLKNKIYLAFQYVYAYERVGVVTEAKEVIDEIISILPTELRKLIKTDEEIKNYMLKFIVEIFSVEDYAENGVHYVDQIFSYSNSYEDCTKVFQEDLKLKFKEFLINQFSQKKEN
ncbi:hypothetical protein [Clostridium frigidicarnis]|uniref:Uncharacterized protein n=1 Tax=Clostridium frigidicarnis TaxID=84698 RepID=A0A1I1AKJ3_9CLOT|nr:hypothetical protein [Clostridium frigidicarnis]SFB38524.1 hypothetical protein SAMN04488528_103915 [Clostridium frigidicarnis]